MVSPCSPDHHIIPTIVAEIDRVVLRNSLFNFHASGAVACPERVCRGYRDCKVAISSEIALGVSIHESGDLSIDDIDTYPKIALTPVKPLEQLEVINTRVVSCEGPSPPSR